MDQELIPFESDEEDSFEEWGEESLDEDDGIEQDGESQDGETEEKVAGKTVREALFQQYEFPRWTEVPPASAGCNYVFHRSLVTLSLLYSEQGIGLISLFPCNASPNPIVCLLIIIQYPSRPYSVIYLFIFTHLYL